MGLSWIFLASFITLGSAAVRAPVCNSVDAPVWSTSYSVKGVINIPYAELTEPFSAWYDGSSQRSRVDYYGDMVQTYQLRNEITPYGSSIKVAPVTTDDQTNVKSCLQVNGTEDEVVKPQSVLPDLTNFECVGGETINGQLTEKWALEETIQEKRNLYTFWLFYKEERQRDHSGIKVPVPVRFEMRGFNILLGSHYDHYYIEYNSFDNDPVPSGTFVVASNLTCTHFPGPGAKHIYTFNPIAEFIRPEQTQHVDLEFNKFLNKHRKNYSNNTEHVLRKEIFKQNLRIINAVNRQNLGYTLAVNHLADKTDNELKAFRGRTYSGVYNGGAAFPYETIKAEDFPDQYDWRLYGAVTPVKDQSICGSCWSFGTVGAVEGANFVKTGKLIRLSEQALIDCSWGYGNNGCDGGEDFRSYQWILKHGGIPSEEAYGPYLGQDGYCHADNVEKAVKITGFVNVTTNDPNALKLAIFKQGPISVAIDASQKTFSFYSNGVYYDPACGNKEENLDHAVLAVGYGSINGNEFWLVKNSWSNYWGNDGYVLMAIKDNNCGVMTAPTYVTV